MRPRSALNSAESSFYQHVSRALRLISSFIAAPAVTAAVPGGRFGVLVAHVGHHRRLPVVAAADRLAAAGGVCTGCSVGRHNEP
jgi:hypothetical protein